MGLPDQIDNAVQSFTTWAIVTCGGGVMWLIRRVLTNQRQIEILEAEFTRRDEWYKQDASRRDQQRTEDRDMVRDIGKKVDALYERNVK